MDHKEMTAHIRKRMKAMKIPARVRMTDICGVEGIQVFVKKYGDKWTDAQRREIAICAKANRLTEARGSEIDPDLAEKLTGKDLFEFEFRRYR